MAMDDMGGGMAPAPGMGADMGMEPGMEPGMGAPAPATAEDVMQADAVATQERMAAAAEMAPTPEGQGIEVTTLNMILDQVNRITSELNRIIGEESIPRVTWSAGTVKKWQSQIPPEIFLPVVALVGTAQQVGMTQHTFDPVELFATSGGAKSIAAKLKKMGDDKSFIEAAAAANDPAAAQMPAEEAPPMEPMSPEEQMAQDDLMMEAM